jgi:hypothetical protein
VVKESTLAKALEGPTMQTLQGRVALHKMISTDYRAAKLDLNFGYDGPNSILRGEQAIVDSGFVDYEIETNTTASFIRVSARTLHLERLP